MQFPLELRFKVPAISPQIRVQDAAGQLLYYVKQKAFKLREAITVFADEAQTSPRFRIAADRILDISASYHIEDQQGRPIGTVRRRGMRSFWKAHYEVDRDGTRALEIQEENPWLKVIDGLVGEIPVFGLLTGYVLHPAYIVSRAGSSDGVLRVVKRPALFEGRYRIEQLAPTDDATTELALLGILMMVLLERNRG